jgi:cobalt-zinc-cadmium efflux system outer membrane protein
VARARIAEAEAGLLDPSARFRDNPALEVAAGPRTGSGGRFADVGVGFSQQFDTGGQRRARIAAAGAAVERERATAEAIVRRGVFEAASAFIDGVAAAERLRVAEEALGVSRDLLNVSERRFAAGDIAAIDVNLSRIDAARSAAAVGAARADLDAALAALRTRLRMPDGEGIELRGSLDDTPLPPLERLEAAIEQQPELRVLAAEVRAADAVVDLGRALARPDVGIRVGYEREEGDTIVVGGLTLTLPMFQRGQGTLATGLARGNAVRLELEIARERAIAELRAAYRVHRQRVEVATALQQAAGPSVTDNEGLARRSYEAGEMNLRDVLIMRREAMATRLEIVERRLDAALSRLLVLGIAGVLP